MQMILAGAGASCVACLSLVAFCGLLQPSWRLLEVIRRAGRCGRESSRGDAGERPVASATSLNSIELALIAELSLEQARSWDEVANDLDERPETRSDAAQAARDWRARASVFQRQARRQTGRPFAPDLQSLHDGLHVVYTGPERRRRTRRTRTRRVTTAPRVLERRDAYATGDRRRRDRRRRELAIH